MTYVNHHQESIKPYSLSEYETLIKGIQCIHVFTKSWFADKLLDFVTVIPSNYCIFLHDPFWISKIYSTLIVSLIDTVPSVPCPIIWLIYYPPHGQNYYLSTFWRTWWEEATSWMAESHDELIGGWAEICNTYCYTGILSFYVHL